MTLVIVIDGEPRPKRLIGTARDSDDDIIVWAAAWLRAESHFDFLLDDGIKA